MIFIRSIKKQRKEGKKRKKLLLSLGKVWTCIKCINCGRKRKRLHKHLEYIFQEIEKCKCGGSQIIEAIYLVPNKKTKKEKEWEKLLKKWEIK